MFHIKKYCNDLLKEFAEKFYEQVSQAKENDYFAMGDDDFFTTVMLEYLEEAGETDSPILCPFRDRGLQLNAYAFAENFESVELFVSIFCNSSELSSVPRTDIDACMKRAIMLYRKAINDLYTSFEKDSSTYEFAITLFAHKEDIKNVKITALTNGLVKSLTLDSLTIDDTEITFGVWDIDRLYRCVNSGKMRETITIDFLDAFGCTIDCVENSTSEGYSVYLAIIPGDILAQLYEKHGTRLLERNVRSFLQVKGQVNKGIRNTLRDSPDMFLAYNNGISVTAESVDIQRDESGRPSIRAIRDMQIVNGGQTTASLYSAKTDSKTKTNLSKVYVQMKLSVIKDSKRMDEIVPKISEYANTQNKVQIADFSANDPYHRKIEELSRTIWAPAQGGQKPKNWFYERARGQYADMVFRQTTLLRKKQYKFEHPVFTKTDLAKYESTWDQLPNEVSEGAQKNFKKFTVRLNKSSNIKVDEKYYRRLIAKAILFRETEKLVQRQNYGGYRANIVTYTLAFLSNRTSQRIDLERIWREQGLTPILINELTAVSVIVHQHITNPPGGRNIGEWCKATQCWADLLETEYAISDDLSGELVSVTLSTSEGGENANSHIGSDEEENVINQVMAIPVQQWFSLSHWAKETDNFQGWQRSLTFKVGTILSRNRKPTYKQANQVLLVLREAQRKGFE